MQQGNNQQAVFFVDDDSRVCLDLLQSQGARFGFRLEGYCLMTKHVHVVGAPATEDSLAKTLGRTQLLYIQYVNRTHGRSGHVWQNRFCSCAMDEAYFFTARCYVERNPVRAKRVTHDHAQMKL